jgi:acyl-CoA reductase-like NAD-dependent aldehyde dehydrogenase
MAIGAENRVRVCDRLYIGGAWVEPAGQSTIEVLNASTEAVIGLVPEGNAVDVERAVMAARRAFARWSTTSPGERGDWMARIAAALEARTEEIASMIAQEVGTPLSFSMTGQAGVAVKDFANMAQAVSQITWEEQIGNSLVVREPIGVVGAITPWNYPLRQICTKSAGAMAAGCTVVVKPSEFAPLTAFLLGHILDEIDFPPGVFNLVSGTGPEAGEALVTHPDIEMVSFTGSTRAGKRISELAAQSAKPVALELGGKSPAVILEGADLKAAVTGTMAKCYQNTGQTCSALTRMLVPRSLMGEIEQLAAQAASEYVVGDALAVGTTLGPLISDVQRERVRAYIRKGVEEGAKLVCGGEEAPAGFERGYFVAPTVFSVVTPDMTIAREEIFGPVLAIMPYDGEHDAIRKANDSDYGLSAAVWAVDEQEALRVARTIRTGQVSINGGPYNPAAPFGGFKQSGHGRENGRYGLEEFLTTKVFNLATERKD